MAFINPLDLNEIFVNKLAGDPIIFMFLAFLVIGILAARFKMPMVVMIGMVSLFAVMMFTVIVPGGFVGVGTYAPIVALVMLLLVALIVGLISRFMNR